MVKKRFPNKRIVFIPNGVAEPRTAPETSVLQEFDLEPQQYILTAARFVPEKGLHDLVAAYRQATGSLPKLVIAGGANYETAYSRSLRSAAEDVESILLTGALKRNKLCELYMHSRLFVLPSHYEGLPITLLEAISHGAPVLVSDIDAHQELDLPSYCYFPVGNSQMLAEKMVELCRTPVSRRERMVVQQRIMEAYNWDRIARAVGNIYEKLCSA
jgi:glycosyltransferase involved in cell wall biosynthesis